MADISTELARILSAIYGEDVRGSIHDAIEKINDVSEVVLTTGTAVTGPSSSSTGFYDDSLYLNTDTFELWKCTGVNTWASQGILKGEAGDDGNGIVSIVKTSTSGLVDTYTITYTDGTTSTFDVTNGEDGANGNKWYRGTGISGKAALPTVYTGSGVVDANSGDMFLNPSEGAVYSCVTGGVPTVATWQYEMTLSGGGGGTSDYTDLTNKPSINGHTLSGNQTGSDLGLASSSDIPTVDQTYNATSSNAQSGTAVASAISGKADTSLLKSTVGWTGKNLLGAYLGKRYDANGVLIDDTKGVCSKKIPVQSGDSFIASKKTATASGKAMLLREYNSSGTLTNSITVLDWNQLSATYTVPASVYYISVSQTFTEDASESVMATYETMLRDASITDDTYEPYHPSVENVLQDAEVTPSKNLLPIKLSDVKATNVSGTWSGNVYTKNGVTYTFTVNDEDYITNVALSGTASATTELFLIGTGYNYADGVDIFLPKSTTLILSDEVGEANKYFSRINLRNSSNTNVTWAETQYESNKTLQVPDDVSALKMVYWFRILNGINVTNKNFKPMIRYASETDDTFKPYYIPLKDSKFDRAEQRVLGAKNLLPLTLSGIKALNSSRTWNGNSCEHNGITFTVNVDDKGNVTSISESGTATGFAFLRLVRVSSFSGSYILNKGIAANKFVYIQNETTNVLIAISTGGDTLVNLTPTNDDVNCIVGVVKDQTGDGTFYPMLRLASDPDDTYVPYAMTNRELTEAIANIVTDDWTTTRQVQSDGTVTFTGLNDSYSYSRPYYELPSGDSAYTFSKVTKSGSGTSVTLTYTTDAPSGTVCKLRILK